MLGKWSWSPCCHKNMSRQTPQRMNGHRTRKRVVPSLFFDTSHYSLTRLNLWATIGLVLRNLLVDAAAAAAVEVAEPMTFSHHTSFRDCSFHPRTQCHRIHPNLLIYWPICHHQPSTQTAVMMYHNRYTLPLPHHQFPYLDRSEQWTTGTIALSRFWTDEQLYMYFVSWSWTSKIPTSITRLAPMPAFVRDSSSFGSPSSC